MTDCLVKVEKWVNKWASIKSRLLGDRCEDQQQPVYLFIYALKFPTTLLKVIIIIDRVSSAKILIYSW